jgi:hypothetical protein
MAANWGGEKSENGARTMLSAVEPANCLSLPESAAV